ncbi:MAG: hypothetical protein MJB14_13110 [Spirochaetes bacterium]|nr:hypothetical protein [Spirochaetota bacterium]
MSKAINLIQSGQYHDASNYILIAGTELNEYPDIIEHFISQLDCLLEVDFLELFSKLFTEIDKLNKKDFFSEKQFQRIKKIELDLCKILTKTEKFWAFIPELTSVINPSTLIQISECYSELSEDDRAVFCLKEILKIQPQNTRAKQIIERYQLEKFHVFFDSIEKTIEWVGDTITLPFKEANKILVKLGDTILLDASIESKTSFGFADDDEDDIHVENENFILEIKKGMFEHYLIIKPKRER